MAFISWATHVLRKKIQYYKKRIKNCELIVKIFYIGLFSETRKHEVGIASNRRS